MFDTVPTNLPVEPAPKPAPAPVVPPVPVAPPLPPASASPTPNTGAMPKTGKEPEDIFSGIQAMTPKPTVSGAPMSASAPAHSMKAIIFSLFGVVLVLGAIGGGVWYFFFRVTDPTPIEITDQTAQTPIIEKPPVMIQEAPVTQPPAGTNIPAPGTATGSDIVPITIPSSTTPETATLAPTEAPKAVVATAGIDSDVDGLTDVEESLYGTNPDVKDTDGDGYSDGSEVIGLYSPLLKGKAITTDRSVEAVTFSGMSFLIPSVWKFTNENDQGGMLTTGAGTQISFQLMSYSATSTISNIFPSDLPTSAKKTKSGLAYQLSPSGKTAYVISSKGDVMFRIAYDLHQDPTDEFETTLQMILNSLTASK